jgi:hypothetical protein
MSLEDFEHKQELVGSRGLTLADDLDPMRATNYLIKQVEPRDPLIDALHERAESVQCRKHVLSFVSVTDHSILQWVRREI